MTKVKGCRVHYRLGAQQVKEAMASVGIDDFAGWVLSDKNGPNSRQGLRYEQFIAVLINGIKQLDERLERLEKQSGVRPDVADRGSGPEFISPLLRYL
ncbi:hypothetical protein ACTACL_01855 [Pseudomonas syringae]|uniref:hypothetical protein n=1 Tax=Pseudomonas syringae TaxID=317 RepID=UPI003F79277A